MNNFLIFIFFSTLEYFSVLFVSLVLWDFNTKKIFKIICLSILYSSISYIFREFKLDTLAPIYTILITMIIFYYFYRAKWLYSFLISLSGYLIAAVAQVILVVILLSFKVVDMNDLKAFADKGYWGQLATFVIVIIIGIWIKVNGNIISFIPEEKYKVQTPIHSNKILLILSIFVCSFIAITVYLIFYFEVSLTIYILLLVITLSISTLLFLLYKRDGEEFGHLS